MQMDSNIRVRVEDKYSEMYNEMKNVLVLDSHRLFFICTCLGFEKRYSVPLKKPEDKFWSKTITPEEWTVYYCLQLVSNDMDLAAIEDDKKTIKVIEEYANGGMEILLNDLLENFVVRRDGIEMLKLSDEDLPFSFLMLLSERAGID